MAGLLLVVGTPGLTSLDRGRVTPETCKNSRVHLVTRGSNSIVCQVMESVSAVPRNQVVSGSAQDADAMVALLFEQEGQRLVALARFFTDDRTAAEDLVQEAFIRLARNTQRIRDTGKAAAYLRSIVVNLARDHNRRGLVSLRHRPPAVLDEPSAEETASRAESRREVVAALRALPHRQRECLALRYYLELPVDEIAEVLGLSANSVKTHLKRGLRGLAARLEETHG
jgi:RNA polymerase sigma-70 factor (sigma-E family)